MKFIAAIILSMVTVYAHAQVSKGQHEVSASCGTYSSQQWSHGGFGMGGDFVVRDAGLNYFLTYRYYFGGRFSLGLVAGKHQFSVYDISDYRVTYRRGVYDYTTVAVECFLNYVNHQKLRFYSYLGLGCSYHTEKYNYKTYNPWGDSTNLDKNQFGFNFQYVPLGLSFGGRLAAFVELGFGYKGLVNAGLSFRFPYHDQPFTYTRQNYRNPY